MKTRQNETSSPNTWRSGRAAAISASLPISRPSRTLSLSRPDFRAQVRLAALAEDAIRLPALRRVARYHLEENFQRNALKSVFNNKVKSVFQIIHKTRATVFRYGADLYLSPNQRKVNLGIRKDGDAKTHQCRHFRVSPFIALSHIIKYDKKEKKGKNDRPLARAFLNVEQNVCVCDWFTKAPRTNERKKRGLQPQGVRCPTAEDTASTHVWSDFSVSAGRTDNQRLAQACTRAVGPREQNRISDCDALPSSLSIEDATTPFKTVHSVRILFQHRLRPLSVGQLTKKHKTIAEISISSGKTNHNIFVGRHRRCVNACVKHKKLGR